MYLLGGKQSISSGIENILKKYSNKVTRIAGRDRYETSAKVAAMSKKRTSLLQVEKTSVTHFTHLLMLIQITLRFC